MMTDEVPGAARTDRGEARVRAWAAVIGLLALALVACEREDRHFSGVPPAIAAPGGVTMTELRPGPPRPDPGGEAPFQRNAYAIAEGKRLFTHFNCVGCHAMGGGGMGPPLMDDEWIYGSEPENIFATIMEGRPNGMPSFRRRIPPDRVWWLVGYVRAMSGLVPLDARPGRADQMHVRDPAVMTEPAEPRSEGTPAPRGGRQP